MGDERDWRWTMDDGDSSRLFGCTASTPIQTMQTNKQRTEQSLLTVVGAATLSIIKKLGVGVVGAEIYVLSRIWKRSTICIVDFYRMG